MVVQNLYEEWASGYAGFESPHIALTKEQERQIGENVRDIAIRFQIFDGKAIEILPEYKGLNGDTPDFSIQPLIKDLKKYAQGIRDNLERARMAVENPRNNLERIIILGNTTPMQREFGDIFADLNSTTGFFYGKNVNLALFTAWKTYKNNTYLGIDLDDFASESLRKLEDAIGSFNFSYGTKFSTYALYSIYNVFKRLMAKKGKIERRPYSLSSTPLDNDRSYPIVSDRELDPAIATRLSESMQMLPQDIREAVGSLSSVEQEVIYSRFGFNGTEMTLEQVGQVIGLTKERVRQIQIKALEKLKMIVGDHSITCGDLVYADKLG